MVFLRMKLGKCLVLKLSDQLLLELLSYKFILGSSGEKSKGSYLMFWLLNTRKHCLPPTNHAESQLPAWSNAQALGLNMFLLGICPR